MKMTENNLPDGYTVQVIYHYTDKRVLDVTVAYLKHDDLFVSMGRSHVNHKKEKAPTRKMGRHIAVGRAMAAHFRSIDSLDYEVLL